MQSDAITIIFDRFQVNQCADLVGTMLRGDATDSRFFVPEDMVGRIIGRGGAVIKQLRVQSGADIRIDELCDRDTARGGRSLTIRGSLDSVIRAEKLVQEKLGEKSSSKHRAEAAAGIGSCNGREWPDDGSYGDEEAAPRDGRWRRRARVTAARVRRIPRY